MFFTRLASLVRRATMSRRRASLLLVAGASIVAVVAFSIVTALAAPLAGSSFDTSNGDLTSATFHDWNPATTGNLGPLQPITCPATAGAGTLCGLDLTASSSDDSFAQGPKEDDLAPAVGTGGIPPNKDDLSRFYVNQEKVGTTDYLYLAWERTNLLGSAHMDFEFNQSKTASANGVTKVRTAGDMLITFDFGGSGVPTLNLSRWVTTVPSGSTAAKTCEANNAVPCWGKLVALGSFSQASVNGGPVTDNNPPGNPTTLAGSTTTSSNKTTISSTFGEAAINLTGAGVFQGGGCQSFGAADLKSRSSGSSFTSTLKDFIAPIPVDISNCGGLTVSKYIDVNENGSKDSADAAGTAADLAGWSFTITGPAGFSCTGTTDSTGAISPTPGASNSCGTADLTALTPGSYTVTENANAGKTIGSNGSAFFNRDPGPAPTDPATTTVSKTFSVGVGGTTDFVFGNACYAAASFEVDGVPSSETGLFAKYTITYKGTTSSPAFVDLVNQGGGVWSATVPTLRTGSSIAWSYGINGDHTNVVAANTFSLAAYPSCAGGTPVQFTSSTISGLKYKDINNDGSRDLAGGTLEPPLQGASFQLLDSSHNVVTDGNSKTTEVSAANGSFAFPGIPAGTYTIKETGQPSATGWVQTQPASNGVVTVTVPLGGAAVTTDTSNNPILFGDTPLSKITVNFASLAKNSDGTDATKATSIVCTPGGSSSTNSLTTSSLTLDQSSSSCVVTFTDP
jgi:hypothetical protein